jgi:hypothetical protein
MNDACISVARTLARRFDALHCLHIVFAESLQLSHSFEQFIERCEGGHSGLIGYAILSPVCPRSCGSFCDLTREILCPAPRRERGILPVMAETCFQCLMHRINREKPPKTP